jgi:hypothetical protein
MGNRNNIDIMYQHVPLLPLIQFNPKHGQVSGTCKHEPILVNNKWHIPRLWPLWVEETITDKKQLYRQDRGRKHTQTSKNIEKKGMMGFWCGWCFYVKTNAVAHRPTGTFVVPVLSASDLSKIPQRRLAQILCESCINSDSRSFTYEHHILKKSSDRIK